MHANIIIRYEYFITRTPFERVIDLKKNKKISFDKITIVIKNKFLFRTAINKNERKKG